VALPSDLDTVKIFGTYLDFNGAPRAGTFTFTASIRVRSAAEHTTLVPSAVIGRLNAQGQLKADDTTSDLRLVATDDADGTPTGWTWSVKEEITGQQVRTYNLPIPLAGGDIDLTGAATDVPPVTPGVTAVTQVNGISPNSTGLVTLTPANIGAAPTSHTHSIAGVVGLQSSLDGKEATGVAAAGDAAHVAASDPHTQYHNNTRGDARYSQLGHTHAIANITGLQSELDGKSATSHTHAFAALTDIPTEFTPAAHSHPIAGVTGLQTALDGKEATGVAAAGLAVHIAAGDPHPQYLTPTEGGLAYAALSHTHTYSQVTGVPVVSSYSTKGTLSVVDGTGRWYNDTGRTLAVQSVRASVGVAPTGSPLVVRLKKNGTTSLGTASIAAGGSTAKTVLSSQTLDDGDYLTIDVTGVGSTTPGSDLVATVVCS
jgi:hypothetical protein